MYENFYGFREKPFSLLPDSGFLYLSSKHRIALTLLEYGLLNQAGFTVISGDIGTGKTTLIRQLLNQIDPNIKVGLISNTHQTFGDLMQWIALAFELPHQGKDKVTLYRDFMDFIIREYGQGRRTVLIVDEAQNMSAETLEELRMLSNVNADKDQVLQVILVGQRELRDTLRRPDLIQFAQRIGVDYHLEPLTEAETREYIRHRCQTAGGKVDLFSDQACARIYQSTGGVPRLINLLCDTALVYGYAEQHDKIDAELINEVARDKQSGGLFPSKPSEAPTAAPEPRSPFAGQKAGARKPPEGPGTAATSQPPGKAGQLRLALAADSELLRTYLARLLTKLDIRVVAALPLSSQALSELDPDSIDVLLVELDDRIDRLDQELYDILIDWRHPILFNDSLATETSLSQPDRLDYGRKLSQKLYSLVPHAPQSVA
jgi:type II secretory pathway predicted ATPase ExeA